METNTSEIWDLLHDLAGCVPFSRPDLYDRVTKVLDGGKDGIANDAIKHKLGKISNAAFLVVQRHDNGCLGAAKDSVAIERLRDVLADVLAESKGEE